MKYSLITPEEVAVNLSKKLKYLRLSKKWKRKTLAERSGVTQASLKRFEQTGKVSLDNLLKLMFALGRLVEADSILQMPVAESIKELELADSKLPQRGSI